MDPAHAQPIGAHGCGHGQQGFGSSIVCAGGLLFQLGNDRRKAGQLERVVPRQVIGRFGQGGVIVQIGAGQTLGLGLRIGRGGAQPFGQVGGNPGQGGGVAGQALGLFLQPVTQRGGPGNVGAAVHVIADPGGKAQRHGGQLAPLVGPFPASAGQQGADHGIAGGLGARQGIHRRAVFGIERDRIALVRGYAGRFCADLAG